MQLQVVHSDLYLCALSLFTSGSKDLVYSSSELAAHSDASSTRLSWAVLCFWGRHFVLFPNSIYLFFGGANATSRKLWCSFMENLWHARPFSEGFTPSRLCCFLKGFFFLHEGLLLFFLFVRSKAGCIITLSSGYKDNLPSLPGSATEDTAASDEPALRGIQKLFAWIWLVGNDIMIYNTVF